MFKKKKIKTSVKLRICYNYIVNNKFGILKDYKFIYNINKFIDVSILMLILLFLLLIQEII